MPFRRRYQIVLSAMLLLFASLHGQNQVDLTDIWLIPSGPAVTVDGVISPGEWDHAARVEISVTKDWVVPVLAQHDDKNLYIAFTGLNQRHGATERYPEVLVDSRNERTLFWQPGQWWLHASYNLCESNRRPDDYSTCKPTQSGWNATRFPLKSASEFAISLDKLALSAGKPFGIAFDVTDTHGQWNFWPSTGKIKIPMSWQKAQLQ
jgi:hypothetical protein